jgi:pimeloyl-ACP methyl ester carboxylesterase
MAQEFQDLHGIRWHETLEAVLTDMTFHYPAVSPAQIRALSVPALVLNGSIEPHEREAALFMVHENPAIEMGLIPGAGHTANIQEPEIYNRVVQSLWLRIARRQ